MSHFDKIWKPLAEFSQTFLNAYPYLTPSQYQKGTETLESIRTGKLNEEQKKKILQVLSNILTKEPLKAPNVRYIVPTTSFSDNFLAQAKNVENTIRTSLSAQKDIKLKAEHILNGVKSLILQKENRFLPPNLVQSELQTIINKLPEIDLSVEQLKEIGKFLIVLLSQLYLKATEENQDDIIALANLFISKFYSKSLPDAFEFLASTYRDDDFTRTWINDALSLVPLPDDLPTLRSIKLSVEQMLKYQAQSNRMIVHDGLYIANKAIDDKIKKLSEPIGGKLMKDLTYDLESVRYHKNINKSKNELIVNLIRNLYRNANDLNSKSLKEIFELLKKYDDIKVGDISIFEHLYDTLRSEISYINGKLPNPISFNNSKEAVNNLAEFYVIVSPLVHFPSVEDFLTHHLDIIEPEHYQSVIISLEKNVKALSESSDPYRISLRSTFMIASNTLRAKQNEYLNKYTFQPDFKKCVERLETILKVVKDSKPEVLSKELPSILRYLSEFRVNELTLSTQQSIDLKKAVRPLLHIGTETVDKKKIIVSAIKIANDLEYFDTIQERLNRYINDFRDMSTEALFEKNINYLFNYLTELDYSKLTEYQCQVIGNLVENICSVVPYKFKNKPWTFYASLAKNEHAIFKRKDYPAILLTIPTERLTFEVAKKFLNAFLGEKPTDISIRTHQILKNVLKLSIKFDISQLKELKSIIAQIYSRNKDFIFGSYRYYLLSDILDNALRKINNKIEASKPKENENDSWRQNFYNTHYGSGFRSTSSSGTSTGWGPSASSSSRTAPSPAPTPQPSKPIVTTIEYDGVHFEKAVIDKVMADLLNAKSLLTDAESLMAKDNTKFKKLLLKILGSNRSALKPETLSVGDYGTFTLEQFNKLTLLCIDFFNIDKNEYSLLMYKLRQLGISTAHTFNKEHAINRLKTLEKINSEYVAARSKAEAEAKAKMAARK